MPENSWFWWEDENTLVFDVLATASAKQTKIGKVHDNRLKVYVSTAPQNGKATKQMIKFLAKEFGVRQNDITLLYGMTTPQKRFRISGVKKLPEIFRQ